MDICKVNPLPRFCIGDVLRPREGLLSNRQSHPSGRLHVLPGRMGQPGRGVITDTEHSRADSIRRCSTIEMPFVIYDCTYREEMERHRGQGARHGNRASALPGRRRAGLALFHHDPTLPTRNWTRWRNWPRQVAGAFAARDGQTLNFPVSLHENASYFTQPALRPINFLIGSHAASFESCGDCEQPFQESQADSSCTRWWVSRPTGSPPSNVCCNCATMA